MGIILEAHQKEKLERYLRNANKFLWGLSRRDQKGTYEWLQKTHKPKYEFNKGQYQYVIDQLIKRYGVEKIIEEVIVPRVEDLFNPSVLSFLRNRWQEGLVPTLNEIKQFNFIASDWRPFLEVNGQLQYEYVESWGQFAGVWFEEIEPCLQKDE